MLPPAVVHPIRRPPSRKGPMLKSQIRADLYREKALCEASQARICTLPQVREKHELAAGVWLDLAEAEDLRSAVAQRLSSAVPADRPASAAVSQSKPETIHGQGPEAI